MASCVKVPLIYAKIALKNAQAFKKLGVYQLYLPDYPYCLMQLDDPVMRVATAFEGNTA